jgi:hypothetical protein
MANMLGRFVAVLFLCGVGSALRAQQEVTSEEPIYDELIQQPVSYEHLVYPMLARQAQIQGTVVVKAKLDRQGKVLEATAISGPRLLIGVSLTNIKGWQFYQNPEKPLTVVVILYDFRLEGFCVSGGCDSLMTFRPRNTVVITAGRMLVDHGLSW